GGRIRNPRDLVTEIFQEFRGKLADLIIVLDNEHATAAAGAGGLAADRSRRCVMLGCVGLRQVDREDRATPERACDRDVAVRLPGEAKGLAEPKAGPLADLLGGEERFEDRSEVFGRNPGAGIGDGSGDTS